jgi:hypothetical protein
LNDVYFLRGQFAANDYSINVADARGHMSQNSASPISYIATRELTGIDSTGREFPIKLAIGQPYPVGSDWRCPVLLEGFLTVQPCPYGIDSFQALMLAQRLARQYLNAFVAERGGRLLDSPGGNTVSLDALFGGGLPN